MAAAEVVVFQVISNAGLKILEYLQKRPKIKITIYNFWNLES